MWDMAAVLDIMSCVMTSDMDPEPSLDSAGPCCRRLLYDR